MFRWDNLRTTNRPNRWPVKSFADPTATLLFANLAGSPLPVHRQIMALQTLSGYLSFAGITGTDATRDASLDLIISEVSDAVKKYLRADLELTTYTDVILDAPPGASLFLPQLPVQVSGFSLSLNAAAQGDPAVFTASDLQTMYTDYVLDTDPSDGTVSKTGIVRKLAGVWGFSRERPEYSLAARTVPCRGAVKVTYTAGYAAVPASIVLAVNLVTSKVYFMRKRGAMLQNESLQAYSYGLYIPSSAQGIIQGDPTIRDLLKPFGRQVFVGGGY